MDTIRTLEISRATPAEVYEIVGIERECRLARWTAVDYQKEIVKENSLILTAKYKTEKYKLEIVGFITARLVAPQELPDNTKTYTELDVLNFGVLEKRRQKGVGGALLDELIKRASRMRVESIWLEVRESNLEAINLYTRKGFTRIQKRRNFYTQPLEDALVLKLAV